jgi:2-haloacid dehalogenase
MALPTFDPRSVSALAEQLFAGRGTELNKHQFGYTWLRTVCVRYADFWKVTEDALVFAREDAQNSSQVKRQQLMQAYLELQSYPDVPPALKSLREGERGGQPSGVLVEHDSTHARQCD